MRTEEEPYWKNERLSEKLIDEDNNKGRKGRVERSKKWSLKNGA